MLISPSPEELGNLGQRIAKFSADVFSPTGKGNICIEEYFNVYCVTGTKAE